MSFKNIVLSLISLVVFAGCSSSKIKERKEQRDKVAQNSKLYCEFINGEMFPDIDVALNLEMAKRCDSEKPFSLTNYKTPTENPGILYCCSTAAHGFDRVVKKKEKDKEEKKDDKSSDTVE